MALENEGAEEGTELSDSEGIDLSDSATSTVFIGLKENKTDE
jgi:hypothetical protein